MKKPDFADGHIYHIFNRGVEKRTTFLDDEDHYRFIHDLYEFNNEDQAVNVKYYFDPETMYRENNHPNRDSRDLLVDILVFTLMPNHYHLIVRQKKTNGIVKFMQKLGTGYTMYFNKKYERVGGLFQGRFKASLINRESHFIYLPHYIHSNPLGLIYGGSTSIHWKKKLTFLENYKWSSYPDYIGKKNFPSVIQKQFLLNFFGDENKYKTRTEEWLKEENNSNLLQILAEAILD